MLNHSTCRTYSIEFAVRKVKKETKEEEEDEEEEEEKKKPNRSKTHTHTPPDPIFLLQVSIRSKDPPGEKQKLSTFFLLQP